MKKVKYILDYYYYLFNSTIYMNKMHSAHINVWMGISIIFEFNIISILFLLDVNFSTINALVLFVFIMMSFYFYYLNNKRYNDIIDKFEETKNILPKIVFNSYIIISLVLLFYSAHYKRDSNGKLNINIDNVWNVNQLKTSRGRSFIKD